MNRLLIITLFLTVFYSLTYSQDNTEVIDKISQEICASLDSIDNIEGLSETEAKQIIRLAILRNKLEWDSELDKIENSRRAGQTIFDYLLNHRLQQDCEKFRQVDNILDKYQIDNEKYRELYLTVKDFILKAESGESSKELVEYFDTKLHDSYTTSKLDLLKAEFETYKRLSGLYIMKRDDHLYFYVNVFNYKNGDENVAVMILFNDLKDNLIDEWEFKTKDEIEAERKKQEEEFENIPPPPPPPSPGQK